VSEHEVTYLKRSVADELLMIALQGLLILSNTEDGTLPPFIEEVNILMPDLIMRGFVVDRDT
jgi:hypothetical protein